MPPPKKPRGTPEQRAERRELDPNARVPTGLTRTGNREVNTLAGGDTRSTPMGSGDFIRDLLFGGGGGGGGPSEGGMGGDGGAGSEEDFWENELRALYEELSKPLDYNDPLVQNILQGARTTTLADLAGRGIHGGYSELNAQQAYTNAAAGLQDQKQARALQALGLGSGRDLQKSQQQFQRDQFNYENDPARGIGGLIGGGLGALGGGIGGFFAGGGPASPLTSIPAALQGAGWGSQAGSQIGAGVGGFFTPRPRARRVAGGY